MFSWREIPIVCITRSSCPCMNLFYIFKHICHVLWTQVIETFVDHNGFTILNAKKHNACEILKTTLIKTKNTLKIKKIN